MLRTTVVACGRSTWNKIKDQRCAARSTRVLRSASLRNIVRRLRKLSRIGPVSIGLIQRVV
jgi:hypothetical protein